ncbi:MAG TPA: SUMF1/EgtB/PvdO family nonheme iron enzyme [Polyangium sp.]|nr:SUMF1/EgtB/PvdO family nonheme iron enzyme [Polyangium sp.]
MTTTGGDWRALPIAGGIAACLLAALLGLGCKDAPSGTKTAPSATAAAQPENAVVNRPRCPPDMAAVESYCVDIYEAHLVRADAPDIVLPHDETPKREVPIMARSRAGMTPQGYVNRADAARACKAAQKRLCSAKEWYQACTGPRKTKYPYGDKEVPNRCNTGKPHLMQRLFGVGVPYTYLNHFNSPRLHKEPGFLAKTGEYSACVNEYGLYDLVGNLHEWVADDVSMRLLDEIPLEYGPKLLGADGSGAFMGGYFSSQGEHGHGCTYTTATHAADYHDYSTGFRCCANML